MKQAKVTSLSKYLSFYREFAEASLKTRRGKQVFRDRQRSRGKRNSEEI